LKPVPSSTDEIPKLLQVSGLSVSYVSHGRPPVLALRQLDLEIAAGEVVGILGESGCGKSTLALTMLGLLPKTAVVNGSILFGSQDLARLKESRWRAIRGAKISLIHQEPSLSLSPVMRVGSQIGEVLRAHGHSKRRARKLRSEGILREVGLSDVGRIYDAYPHQLSGGELHRVAIAQVLACQPDLVIADEPTRSLDVKLQAEILGILRQINQRFGTTLVFITHNPALLIGLADRVVVMYAGRVVEQGYLLQVIGRPLHPYTKGLLQLVPTSLKDGGLSAEKHLPAIPGGPPDLKCLNRGCAFEPRCSRRTEICQSEFPEELAPEEGHRVSCFNYEN
jgi:oligopeptide/dipeptide ABC transporter ATP-binding protein